MIPGLTEDQEKTGRLYVRLPDASIAELAGYIERSGATRSQFLAMAVMLGARALDRALNPAQMMTPTIVQQMTDRMVEVMLQPGNLEKLMSGGWMIEDEVADEYVSEAMVSQLHRASREVLDILIRQGIKLRPGLYEKIETLNRVTTGGLQQPIIGGVVKSVPPHDMEPVRAALRELRGEPLRVESGDADLTAAFDRLRVLVEGKVR